MSATFSNLQDYVETQVQRDDLVSQVTEAINEAILDITLMFRPHEMFTTQTITTSEGTVSYNLASDALAIQNVVITNADGSDVPKDVIRGAVYSWQKRDRGTTNYGVPNKYLRRGNTIQLYDQVADDNDGDNYSVEVSYIKRPTTLSSTSPATESDLNAEWDLPTKYLASAKVFILNQDFDKANTMLTLFNNLVQLRNTPQGLENEYDNESVGYMNG